MIKFEFYNCNDDELSNETIRSLWDQDVCMDDWDYLLFFENETDFSMSDSRFYVQLEPKEYNVSRLLAGCCKNSWYYVKDFMGRKGVIGIAYHA